MKIICIDFNYPQYNLEVDGGAKTLPTTPILFMKPDSSILKDNKPFYIPDFTQNVLSNSQIVVRINRLGKNIAERFAHRYYDEITIGIDFRANDLQKKLSAQGLPWEVSTGFDNSAVLGEFINKENSDVFNFSLSKNAKPIQVGLTSDMIFSIDKIIAYVSQFFTLKIGDFIFTGTPSRAEQVQIDDHMEGFVGDKRLLNFYIR